MKRCISNHKSAIIHSLFFVLFVANFLGMADSTRAASRVLRDSIGPDSSLTDGLGGGSTLHTGPFWHTPGFVVEVPATESGILTEAQIVIFARDLDSQPENDLADIYDFSMDFHVWSDGVQGGPDSFFDNAIGFSVGDHIVERVNCNAGLSGCNVTNLITVEEFGKTGPASDPTLFTTFLVTIDLLSFGIALQGGEQYVAAVIDPALGPIGRGILFRVIGSRATGFEDMFQQDDTVPLLYPGYVASQHNLPFEQYAAKLTLGNGDFDGDDDVDGRDFLVWQLNFGFDAGEGNVAPESFGNTNGDRYIDGKDLNVWQATYGQSWAGTTTSIGVPEPSGVTLLLLATLGFLNRRGHRERGEDMILDC